MERITGIRIKQNNGTYSAQIPIGSIFSDINGNLIIGEKVFNTVYISAIDDEGHVKMLEVLGREIPTAVVGTAVVGTDITGGN